MIPTIPKAKEAVEQLQLEEFGKYDYDAIKIGEQVLLSLAHAYINKKLVEPLTRDELVEVIQKYCNYIPDEYKLRKDIVVVPDIEELADEILRRMEGKR